MWAAQFNSDRIARVFAGAAEASVSTDTVAFGAVEVGATGAQTVTLTNTGTLDLAVAAVALTGSSAITLTGATTCAASTVLHAGESCALALRFAPLADGPAAATLTVAGTPSR